MSLIDAHGRRMRKLRVQLTDACNFRCFYCMPEGTRFQPAENLLSPEEIGDIGGALANLGIEEVRVTGGEPELVYVPDPGAPPTPTSLEDLSARITLRLPETLKAIVDAAAQEAGVSANTWLLQQIHRSADPTKRRSHPGGRRMTGYGQS